MSELSNHLPPCIVLGLETQIGLNVVRELGQAGVPIIGVTHESDAIGLSSRYLVKKVVVEEPRGDTLISAIRSLGDEYGPCCLMAVSEVNQLWLNANAQSFGVVKVVGPSVERLAIVLDKQKTLDAARHVGIAVPETVELTSVRHAEALAAALAYPVVLKWRDPNAVAKKLSANGLEQIKAEYVYTHLELLKVVRRYECIGQWPIIQSYARGQGLGQFFFMRDGEALRRFQHLRIAEWPPEGGFSSVCDSLPLEHHVGLQERSIALLRHIGWEGVAMVEYRWDALSGQAVLMEINGRYWGSFPLAVQSKASFALISYFVGSGLGVPHLPALRNNIRSRMVATEIKRLVRIWLHPNLIRDRSFQIRRMSELRRFVFDFFRPNVHYYVWSVSDPKPFFADVRNFFRKLMLRFGSRGN